MQNSDPTWVSSKPWTEVAPRGPLLRRHDVFGRTGLSRAQVYEMIKAGQFPPFVKLSVRAAAMPESWLNAFVEERAQRALAVSKG